MEYRYTIPNYETENFSFDREAGILQEEADERRFYERVVKPKTSHLPFRQQQEPSRDIDYEVNTIGPVFYTMSFLGGNLSFGAKFLSFWEEN